jgi:hypothetical protein
MCKEGYSPEEIVEFFKTYVSKKMKIESYMKNFLKNHRTSDKVFKIKIWGREQIFKDIHNI